MRGRNVRIAQKKYIKTHKILSYYLERTNYLGDIELGGANINMNLKDREYVDMEAVGLVQNTALFLDLMTIITKL